jgi:release factor glutamine methyltransferase
MARLDQELARIGAQLAASGIESPENDAELLAAFVLEVNRGELLSKAAVETELTNAQLETLNTLATRRAAREPLQHLTGLAYFRNLELRVGKGVFVPRPETEAVAQLAIDSLAAMASPEPIAIDLGTGSGAIALSLATEVSHAKVYAVELSADALPFTRQNFARIAPNATLIEGDFASLDDALDGRVSVVVSNPPYIPVDAIPRDIEVREHDPKLALYSGEDGMDAMRVVSKLAQRLLHLGGTLVVEHADNQAETVCQLLLADGWRQVRSHKDLTGRDRAVSALK